MTPAARCWEPTAEGVTPPVQPVQVQVMAAPTSSINSSMTTMTTMTSSMTLGGSGGDLFGSSVMRQARVQGVEACSYSSRSGADEESGAVISPTSWRSTGSKSRFSFDSSRDSSKPAGPCVLWSYKILTHGVTQSVMIALTIAVLYFGDLVQAVAEVSSDYIQGILLYVCLVMFAGEWIISVVCSDLQSPKYKYSLFFVLDLIATFSIALDIAMLEGNNLTQNGPVARAARAARLGTRAGRSLRLMRLLRFVRLVRVTRVIKAVMRVRESRQQNGRVTSKDLQGDGDLARADSIGAQIGATMTKKVIVMTLILLVILPLLERNMGWHLCGGEFFVALEALSRSSGIDRDCAKLRTATEPWFRDSSTLLTHTKDLDAGLTSYGLIYAVIDHCELYRDPSIMGAKLDWSQTALTQRRRSTEIHTLPCDVEDWRSENATQAPKTPSFLIFDMRAESIEEAQYAMGLTTMIVVVLLGFAMIFSQDAESLANKLVVPIRQLMIDMGYISSLELGKVTQKKDVFVSDIFEVRRLQTSFSNLAGAVGSFAKFSPLEVVRHLLATGQTARLGVVRRNVSIFFSDIAGFTTICESCQPADVLTLLSEYFESMVSIIIEEQGTMLEFIGDAILAIWNAPNEVSDHACRATTAALRMNFALEKLRVVWLEQGKPPVRVRVGLHAADVYVGNLGSEMRMKYGVLGDGVNLASRLEELNKRYKTEILISEDVLRQDRVRQTFVTRPIDLVVVKGRRTPTSIHEVLAFKATATEPQLQIAKESERVVEAYLNRDFSSALMSLSKIKTLKNDSDPAGDVLTERCKQFLMEPPPPNWNGAEVLSQKTF
eukprot:TRINITY_DN27315_c0_g5_i1.p1 TRINITY_DN27315_c0_g5~~TRINITY_DN27315_c0_g5_i1.p1  ORF type:complete len:832 (-),score=134.27 TRINITY_DN27315_c0_g5_i1:87-2582(-)